MIDQNKSQFAIHNEDEARLAALGRKQQMKPNFNVWSSARNVLLHQQYLEAITGGFVASATGALLIALSLSEFASIVPTSGGQYHYVAELSHVQYRPILSRFAGWITAGAWILTVVGGTFSTAMQITAYAILCNPDYQPQRYHASLIFIALTTIYTLMNIFAIRIFHKLNISGMALHCIGFITTMVYLLAKAHPKNTAMFVFTDFENLSGWHSNGVAWSIGLLSSALGFIGWDSSAHMAEEMQNAAKDLPTATTHWRGFGSILYLSLFEVIWAFARDKGLSKPIAQVNRKLEVPVYAIGLIWLAACAIGLIYIGNSTAYYSISSGVTVSLMLSYALPIAVNLIWGIKYLGLKKSPFSLGRWTTVINVAALCWCCYLIVFLSLPTLMSVTKENMKYCTVVLAFFLLLATVSWIFFGRKHYHGPNREIASAELTQMYLHDEHAQDAHTHEKHQKHTHDEHTL
ncbi:hypothetical protein LTR96_011013 [Exophiala xenobiotica]|nr:hypothetical protein LTR96_011013 [Exophiala xenobiotica]KAK5400907.1 hypothetical protein LTR06_011122 [Exophiala xenobiotica]